MCICVSITVYSYSLSCILLFYFFKQKTAYEMLISDWSSDVCSSDLIFGGHIGGHFEINISKYVLITLFFDANAAHFTASGLVSAVPRRSARYSILSQTRKRSAVPVAAGATDR